MENNVGDKGKSLEQIEHNLVLHLIFKKENGKDLENLINIFFHEDFTISFYLFSKKTFLKVQIKHTRLSNYTVPLFITIKQTGSNDPNGLVYVYKATTSFISNIT